MTTVVYDTVAQVVSFGSEIDQDYVVLNLVDQDGTLNSDGTADRVVATIKRPGQTFAQGQSVRVTLET